MSAPKLTVVVPTYNAPGNLVRCLEALAASTVEHELIVVDDCSTQAEALETARRLVAGSGRLIELEQNGGPGVARNEAVKAATGDVVVFIDSDVLVEPRTLERMQRVFVDDPEIAALFGSYDDCPDSPGTITEYRNLLHHWVHQNGPSEASTFWSGCGAVRREVFLRLGGFDTELYDRPSIEDIELGMRIKASGGRIRLCPDIQVKHLKRWRLWEMVKVDVTCRAIPWTRLLIDRPGTGGDLNLESGQKLCVVFVFLAVAGLAAGLGLTALQGQFAWLALPLLPVLPVIWINRGLYGLFLRHRGPLFAAAGVALHLLYYLYSGLAFLWAHLSHASYRRRSEPAAA